jgi:hypothetical protein
MFGFMNCSCNLKGYIHVWNVNVEILTLVLNLYYHDLYAFAFQIYM